MEETFEVRWAEAMNWWKGQSENAQGLIRRIAEDNLIERGAEEIGSSDLNHAVYALYQQYKSEGSPEVLPYLIREAL
jgi:hypothetical protein